MQTREEIVIGSKLDAKGFKQAETALDKLGKSAKQLGAALGIAFGARALARFATSSAKAFAEDEKATARLTQSIKNLGLALSANDINKYIETLSLQTGVVDDQLRPAMQALLQVTGSVTKSQELLNTAINVSRGSGESLTTVANDLAQAYVGNLKGLRKYNLGLTQAELKTASYAEIQDKLNKTFAGSSAAYLKTYAGQWELLTTNANEAKEVIGKGVIDSLLILSGNTSVKDLATDMQILAKSTAGALTQLATFAKTTYDVFKPILDVFGGIKDTLDFIAKNFPSLNLMVPKSEPGRARRFFTGGQNSTKVGEQAAAEKLAKQRAAELLKLQKQQLKAAKDNALLKKASAIFDLAQIQIVAALKGKISEEDKKRLELQMAILSGNADEVIRISNELANVQGKTKELSLWLKDLPTAKNPFEDWMTYLDKIAAKVASLGIPVAGQPSPPSAPPSAPSTNNPLGNAIGEQYASAYQGQAGGVASNLPTVVNIYPQGNVITERDLATMLGASLETASQSGGSGGSWSGVRVL
jgi:hypothetical protein